MPSACFSYSAALPLGAGNRNTAQQTLRDTKICFSYSGDMPLGIRNLGIRNRSAAQLAPCDLSSMPGGPPDFPATGCFSYPTTACFRYVGTTCFRY